MANENVMEFTTANWEKEVVESDKPVLVDFWAPWCGPCRMLGPTIDRLADRYAGKVKVEKVNVDDSPEIAGEFGVTSIPRVFIFKGGKKPLHQITGVAAENQFSKLLDQVLTEQV